MPDMMRNKRIEQINREDSRAGKKFLVVLLVSMVLGGILGGSTMQVSDYMNQEGMGFTELLQWLTQGTVRAAQYVLVVSNIIMFPVIILRLKKHVKAAKAWDGEDERLIEEIESRLLADDFIICLQMMITLISYGIGFYRFPFQEHLNWKHVMILMAFFLVSLLYLLLSQRIVINMRKVMNPEKRGSVFDLKFDKKWWESSDEAERQSCGLSAYQTYQIMGKVYAGLLVVFMLAGFVFEVGILPLLTAGGLWIAHTVIYLVQRMKLRKKSAV